MFGSFNKLFASFFSWGKSRTLSVTHSYSIPCFEYYYYYDWNSLTVQVNQMRMKAYLIKGSFSGN